MCVQHDEEEEYETFTQSDGSQFGGCVGRRDAVRGPDSLGCAMPSYGGDFLRIVSSVYPGADTAPKLGRVLLGTLYGFVDGGIAGLLFGWLYSAFAGGTRAVSK